MSLSVTLTFVGGVDAATSAFCVSTGDATTPTTHGSQEIADADAGDVKFITGANGGANEEWCAGTYQGMPNALAIESVTITRRDRQGVGIMAPEVHKTRALFRSGGANYYSSYVT